MNKKKGKSKYALVLVLFLLVGITIGYAALETALNIKGTSSIGENSTWDVHFENAELTDNDNVLQAAPTIDAAATKVSYTAALNAPGEVIEFTVDVVNKGGLDAKASADSTLVLAASDPSKQAALEAALDYTATEIAANEELAATSGTKTITFTVKFKDSITNEQFNAVAGAGFTVDYDVNFVQA